MSCFIEADVRIWLDNGMNARQIRCFDMKMTSLKVYVGLEVDISQSIKRQKRPRIKNNSTSLFLEKCIGSMNRHHMSVNLLIQFYL